MIWKSGILARLDPRKLAGVDLPRGCFLRIRRSLAPAVIRSRAAGKWIDLRVSDLPCLMPTRLEWAPLHRAVGPVIAGATPQLFARHIYNNACAAFLRFFRVVDATPVPGIWPWVLEFFVPILLPSFLYSPHPVMSDQDWLASMPAVRRRPLSDAQALYQATGWLQKYAKFKAFPKTEHACDFSKSSEALLPADFSCPRAINGPHDVTHTIAGPKLKPLLGKLKAAWHFENPIFYASTKPVYLRLWLRRAIRRYPLATVFWSDYSMFDNSHNTATWDFMEALYGELMKDAAFRQVMACWRAPSGKFGENLKYRGRVMNASGRDDTALANAVLNGFAMFLSAAAAWYNIDLLSLTPCHLRRFAEIAQIGICGDDALGFLPWLCEEARTGFLVRLRANLSKFGFQAKAYASDRFEDGVFLGHRPLPVDGEWHWSRTIGRCIYKLGWQASLNGDPTAYMAGVMAMHDVCSCQTPILIDIARAWLAQHRGGKITALEPDPNKPWEWMNAGLLNPLYQLDTLEALARAYSVHRDRARGDLVPNSVQLTVADLRDCISYVRSTVSAQPCVLDHWVLRHMVWVDEQ